jgi:hypothetical protein
MVAPHREDPAIPIALRVARFDDWFGALAPMGLRHVDVDHRLVDSRVQTTALAD